MKLTIKEGVLTKCELGKGETQVTVPAGVTAIGRGAFYGGSPEQNPFEALTRVILPEGLTTIGMRAFMFCGNLKDITLPSSLTAIGAEAFSCCDALENIALPDGLEIIGPKAFQWCPALREIVVPDSVTSLGEQAFAQCRQLARVTLPKGLTRIGVGTFGSCSALRGIALPEGVRTIEAAAFRVSGLTHIRLPDSLVMIESRAFYGCTDLREITIPAGVKIIREQAFSDCRNLQHVTLPAGVQVIEREAFAECQQSMKIDGLLAAAMAGCKMDTDMVRLERDDPCCQYWLALLLCQGKKTWGEYVEQALYQDPAFTAEQLLAGLRKYPLNRKHLKVLLKYLEEMAAQLPEETLHAICNCLRPLCSKAQSKTLDALLEHDSPQVEQDLHPVENLCASHFRRDALERFLSRQEITLPEGSVPYAGEETCASPFVLMCTLVPYMQQAHAVASVSANAPVPDVQLPPVTMDTTADEIAGKLHQPSFRAWLDELLVRNDPLIKKIVLAPYCRYATDGQMAALLSKVKTWEDWKRCTRRGRYAAELLKEVAWLSDTRAAMLYAEKVGRLDSFAALHGTTADVLRDTVMLDFGLDDAGRKTYDLGNGKTVVACLNGELLFDLHDSQTGKIVKTLPKRGTDPERYEAVKEEISALRRNTKTAYRQRRDRLFDLFLSGQPIDAAAWQASYLKNPLLRHIARLLVWKQGAVAFLLTDGGLITADGQPYRLSDADVQVAHPFDMPAGEVAAWQQYFLAHQLKQPFEQIWEPVYCAEEIRQERYRGMTLPMNSLRGQEKHGIVLDMDYDEHVTVFQMKDCELTCANRYTRHYYDTLDVELQEFRFTKFTRQVNHIVYRLDRLTFTARLMKDDASIMELISHYSAAQVAEFTNLAIEHQCIQCTAALLAYKHEHFPEADPMDGFLLL